MFWPAQEKEDFGEFDREGAENLARKYIDDTRRRKVRVERVLSTRTHLRGCDTMLSLLFAGALGGGENYCCCGQTTHAGQEERVNGITCA